MKALRKSAKNTLFAANAFPGIFKLNLTLLVRSVYVRNRLFNPLTHIVGQLLHRIIFI